MNLELRRQRRMKDVLSKQYDQMSLVTTNKKTSVVSSIHSYTDCTFPTSQLMLSVFYWANI